jgi:RNA polymerase-associated protein CTR9
VDASTMLGAMCMERGDMASAEKWFGKLSQRGRGAAGAGGASGGGSGSVGSQDLQRDNYAKVAMGNIALLRADGSKEENRRRAAEWFCSVLKHDPHNVYAANGLGAVLAKEQFALEAKEAFAQVREARGDIPDVWVNLAHVYVAQQQYALAIKMYQDALTKFSLHRDALLLLYLARAYFLQGASTQCRSTLMKAIHISPNSSVIW